MHQATASIRIALLTDGVFPITIGGMQKHSYYLAKNLARKGIFVDLFYLPHKNSDTEATLLYDNFSPAEKKQINFIPINWPKTNKLPGHYVIENYLYSKRIFEKINNSTKPYDFIYAKGFSAWHLLHKKKKGVMLPPVGIKFHGYEMFQTSPSLYYSFQKLILQWPVRWNNTNADWVFSYGGKITKIIKETGVAKKKIIEIPTGIDSNWLNTTLEKKSSSKATVKFVFIGRYERRKGIQELNACIEQLPRNEAFEFQFIGPIPISKQLESRKIIYHGTIMQQEKIRSILQNADVLVCPSYSEGMPNVILEAMASGCAIIATDVGAVSEQVDASNGILIEPGNKPELKAAIERMIALPADQLLEMKKASIKRVEEKFLWDKVAELTIAEIKKIIENRP